MSHDSAVAHARVARTARAVQQRPGDPASVFDAATALTEYRAAKVRDLIAGLAAHYGSVHVITAARDLV
jgi:hypothetical protein